MTEVPEHLLARSRARRAALGLGGDDAGGDAAAPAAPAAGTDVEPAAATAAARPAAVTPAEVEPAAPEPVPAYVAASLRRKRVPYWAMPVLAILPIWGILYAQSLTPPETNEVTQLVEGQTLYASKCASCHGGGGGGGVGRQLSDGEVLKTFPNIEQQMEFVKLGDAGYDGQPYGDPNREGGAHIGGGFGSARMPAFKDTLTDEQLIAVVRYEREKLGGEEVPKEALPEGADGKRAHKDGNPYLTEAGELVTSSGEALFDEDGKLTTAEEPDKGAPPSGG